MSQAGSKWDEGGNFSTPTLRAESHERCIPVRLLAQALEQPAALWDRAPMRAPSTIPAGASDLQGLQRKRKLVVTIGIALWVALLVVTESRWRATAPNLYALIEKAGLILIFVCILGRTWCTLYIGGHKKRALITNGPYSVVRNPLYVFTSIGAAGIGAQSGSALIAILSVAASLATFAVVARREEAFLAAAFPADFPAYASRVPRFWPRPSLWQEADELLVKPHLVRRTFFDACLFLLAVPVADLVHWLQDLGYAPILLYLP
jgi:protein-S-isoprenylcysteine O-methyltransferase Ste14